MTQAAVLLMLQDGDLPETADFAAGDSFPTFEAAIRAAHERVAPNQTLVPWISFGGAIIEPSAVMATNTPPAPPKLVEASEISDRLDEDLDSTFPASDPPARVQP